MYLGKTKIFIILFLIFLAIYQTANLWFEGLSNHRFFYNLSNLYNLDYSQINSSYKEKSLIINVGNNKFIQLFNDVYDSSYKTFFDEAISLAINNGKFYQYNDFDLNIVLDNKSIIYNFSYNPPGSEIAYMFNVSNKNLSKIESFDTIAIIPNFNKTDQIQVIFFDTLNLKQYEFTLNSSYGTTIYNLINNFSLEDYNYYYISSIKSGFDLFEQNQFILNWDLDFFSYKNLNVVDPILVDGKKDFKILENYINIFFQNPSIKWNSINQDTITYSDESTVVKYYENGVLEYSNYKNGKSQSNKSIFQLYTLAINFLNTDTNIKNEYYLKHYVQEQDKITFYFDYKINNLPINLSETLKEKLSMESMIEITVSQSKVSKYKRILYDFSLSETTTLLYKDFLNSIDSIIYTEFNDKDYSIQSIEFAYNFDELVENNNKVYAGFFIKINDNIFFQN